MAFFDIYGGMFDFNGDGTTDLEEEMIGMAILDDINSKDKDNIFDFGGFSTGNNRLKTHHIVLIVLFLLGLIGAAIDNSSTNSYKEKYYSSNYGSSYTSSYSGSSSSQKSYSSYRKPAMTKEEAETLKGTGYKGTRPNSWAETHELQCAQVKCDICGMHTDNGYNSACDSCRKEGYN